MQEVLETTIGADALVVRQLGRCDSDAVADAFDRMSPESRHSRYFAPKPMLTRRELRYLTDLDHTSHDALAALDEGGRIVAIARYAELAPATAELAVEVVDEHQGRGLGSELVRQVIELARSNGYVSLRATTMWENRGARALFKKLGFRAVGSEGNLVELGLEVEPRAAPAVVPAPATCPEAAAAPA